MTDLWWVRKLVRVVLACLGLFRAMVRPTTFLLLCSIVLWTLLTVSRICGLMVLSMCLVVALQLVVNIFSCLVVLPIGTGWNSGTEAYVASFRLVLGADGLVRL